MIKNIKFRTRLLLGNSIVLVIMAIVGIVVYLSVNSLIKTPRWLIIPIKLSCMEIGWLLIW